MGSTFSSEEDQKILEAVKSSCENKKLVLSSMNLTALPVQVLSCPPNYLSSIRTIDLKLNPISTMNGITLQHFPSLTSLNLSQTKIGVFPPQLTALHSLQVLKFGQNHLKSLRIDDLKRYTALRELNISGNDLTELPEFTHNPLLEYISVTDNQLTTLPESLGKLEHLIEIECNQNDIDLAQLHPSIIDHKATKAWYAQRVPQEIIPGLYLGGVLAADNHLALKHRGIHFVLSVLKRDVKWPGDIMQRTVAIDDVIEANLMGHLEYCFKFIDFAMKKGKLLVHCAAGVSRSASVIIAYLMKKKSIGYEQALQMVWRRRPCVVPNKGFQSQLQVLEKIGCQFYGPQYEMYCNGVLKQTYDSKLPNLELRYIRLEELPPATISLTHLVTLSLRHNRLKEIPAELEALQQLASLELEFNEIYQIPPHIGKLTSLTAFDVSYNLLQKLPNEISALTKLESFYVQKNSIAELPSVLSSLVNLRVLDVSHNKLRLIPAELVQRLHRLELLNLTNNYIMPLPPYVLPPLPPHLKVLGTAFGAQRNPQLLLQKHRRWSSTSLPAEDDEFDDD